MRCTIQLALFISIFAFAGCAHLPVPEVGQHPVAVCGASGHRDVLFFKDVGYADRFFAVQGGRPIFVKHMLNQCRSGSSGDLEIDTDPPLVISVDRGNAEAGNYGIWRCRDN